MFMACVCPLKPVSRRDKAVPLSCLICHGRMRIFFFNDAGTANTILRHISGPTRLRECVQRMPASWEAATAAPSRVDKAMVLS